VVTAKYLAKFQSQTAVSWPKIIQPETVVTTALLTWLLLNQGNPSITYRHILKRHKLFNCCAINMVWYNQVSITSGPIGAT
jgi:hypothetical protein